MADKRHIVHAHIERVAGATQNEINSELANFFINVTEEHALFESQNELNKGILVIKNDADDPSIYIKNTVGDVVKISGNGSKSVDAYEDALFEATAKNVGQIIYVKEKSIYNDIEYNIGPYIVIGENELMKLAVSLPSGDVDSDVAELKVKVSELMGDITDISNEIDNKVSIQKGYSLVSDSDIEKLSNIEDGAQSNIIEKIVVNGQEIPVTDKSAIFTIEYPEAKLDGHVDDAYIDDVDGKKYLVLTFTENAGKDDILVDVSEMFTEQYSSGNGISLENAIIALRLGEDEKILAFDGDGGLIISEDFINRVSTLEESVTDILETVISNAEAVKGFNQRIPILEESVTELSETVISNTEAVKDFNQRIPILEENVTELSETTASQQEAINKLNEDISKCAKSETVNELSETISSNSESIITLSEDVRKAEENIVSLTNGIETLETNLGKVKIIDVENYTTALQNATDKNIGQIIRVAKDSETDGIKYLKGYYFVEGINLLTFILTSDGKQDEIKVLGEAIKSLQDKTLVIDNYAVNGQILSQEGGVLLNGDDIVLGESLGVSEYIMDSVEKTDSVNDAIRKVENSLGATVIAMTASLNDMNSQINWVAETVTPNEGEVTLYPNRLCVIDGAVSDLVINLNGNENGSYGYAMLLSTSYFVENFIFPEKIILSNMMMDDVKPNTHYLIEFKYNFMRWTKLYKLQ